MAYNDINNDEGGEGFQYCLYYFCPDHRFDTSYTLSNYKKDITLEEISALSNLSITSFCRYFKMMTNKTYYEFLIEIRISHACRMLIENKESIEIICFNCGFNNVSNFYRHFKKITGFTPLEYKKNYLDLTL